MARTSHALDDALDVRKQYETSNSEFISTLTEIMQSARDAIAVASDGCKANHKFAQLDLAVILRKCAAHYEQICGGSYEQFQQEVRREYDLELSRNEKENPLNPEMSNEERAANLIAALGQFAYANNPCRTQCCNGVHGTQATLHFATVAAAWSQHITNTLKKEHNR